MYMIISEVSMTGYNIDTSFKGFNN